MADSVIDPTSTKHRSTVVIVVHLMTARYVMQEWADYLDRAEGWRGCDSDNGEGGLIISVAAVACDARAKNRTNSNPHLRHQL